MIKSWIENCKRIHHPTLVGIYNFYFDLDRRYRFIRDRYPGVFVLATSTRPAMNRGTMSRRLTFPAIAHTRGSQFSGHPSVVIVRNVLVKQAIFHETVNEPTKVSILPFVFVSYPFPPNCIADLLVHSIQVKYFRTREGKTFGQWNVWSSGIVWEGYNVYPSLWKPYLEGGYIPS